MECSIWQYGRGLFKVYLDDIKLRDRIAGWEECVLHCRYMYPGGDNAWDIIFPARLYDRVADLVGLPRKKKNPKRVALGKELGRKAVADDHLKLNVSEEYGLQIASDKNQGDLM